MFVSEAGLRATVLHFRRDAVGLAVPNHHPHRSLRPHHVQRPYILFIGRAAARVAYRARAAPPLLDHTSPDHFGNSTTSSLIALYVRPSSHETLLCREAFVGAERYCQTSSIGPGHVQQPSASLSPLERSTTAHTLKVDF
jgi:hypothetical protein